MVARQPCYLRLYYIRGHYPRQHVMLAVRYSTASTFTICCAIWDIAQLALSIKPRQTTKAYLGRHKKNPRQCRVVFWLGRPRLQLSPP